VKTILLIIATLFATSAFALEINDHSNKGGDANQAQTQGQGQLQGQAQGQLQGQAQGNINVVTNDVSNRISNDVRQNAAAFAAGGDAKAFAGGGDAKSGSYSGGNTQNVVVTDSGKLDYSGKYEVHNVPSVFSGNVYPTAPCMGSSTIGGAGIGWGLSIGSSWTDDECGVRETARSFNGLGMKEDALKILCTSKYAAAAPSCAKPEQQPATK
jgi:hypothetical protein